MFSKNLFFKTATLWSVVFFAGGMGYLPESGCAWDCPEGFSIDMEETSPTFGEFFCDCPPGTTYNSTSNSCVGPGQVDIEPEGNGGDQDVILGACCLSAENCFQTTSEECTGNFFGPGTSCSDELVQLECL